MVTRTIGLVDGGQWGDRANAEICAYRKHMCADRSTRHTVEPVGNRRSSLHPSLTDSGPTSGGASGPPGPRAPRGHRCDPGLPSPGAPSRGDAVASRRPRHPARRRSPRVSRRRSYAWTGPNDQVAASPSSRREFQAARMWLRITDSAQSGSRASSAATSSCGGRGCAAGPSRCSARTSATPGGPRRRSPRRCRAAGCWTPRG